MKKSGFAAIIVEIVVVMLLLVCCSAKSSSAPMVTPTQTTIPVREMPTACETVLLTVENTPTPTIELTATPTPTITPTEAPTPSPTNPPTERPTELMIHQELLRGVDLFVDLSQVYYFEPDYDTTKYITRKTERNEYNYELLAKLLCCEAGGKYSTWEMQVWTLCAILNNLDKTNRSLDSAAHDKTQYSVAGWVDNAKPDALNYKAIDFVLDGHRIAKINCFRTKYFHDFGIPFAVVDNEHFFSVY